MSNFNFKVLAYALVPVQAKTAVNAKESVLRAIDKYRNMLLRLYKKNC